MAQLIYRKGGYSAEPVVLKTDDGKYQGMVILIPGPDGKKPERRCVPTTTTSYTEALDQARALAHKSLANL
jgi:hypothetical protein